MRCPKCGYNSFDHLDNCKKCGKDLTEHKTRFNIQSLLLSEMPLTATTAVAEEATATTSVTKDTPIDDFSGESVGSEAEDFGFDFMGDSENSEDLAFDELFEDVSPEDDVEETLPAPDKETDEATAQATDEPLPLDQELAAEETIEDNFVLDKSEPLDSSDEPSDVVAEAATEFGFSVDEDPDADIFAEAEEDFSLDGPDPEDPAKK